MSNWIARCIHRQIVGCQSGRLPINKQGMEGERKRRLTITHQEPKNFSLALQVSSLTKSLIVKKVMKTSALRNE